MAEQKGEGFLEEKGDSVRKKGVRKDSPSPKRLWGRGKNLESGPNRKNGGERDKRTGLTEEKLREVRSVNKGKLTGKYPSL